MPEPESLQQFAVEALSDFIHSLCFELTGVAKRNKPNPLPLVGASCGERMCRLIHKMFVESIPHSLIDEVTCRLLTTIDDWCFFDSRELTYHDCCVLLLPLVRCVVHPEVKIITALRNNVSCADIFSYRMFRSKLIIHLIERVLPTLKKLKVLNVRSTSLPRMPSMYIPENLEEFSGQPGDNLLELIVTKSPSIKVLNLDGSQYVTERSFPLIAGLKSLEKLNIAHVNFCHGEKIKLLLLLSKNKNLKALRICMSKDFSIFQNYFPQVNLSLIIPDFKGEMEVFNLENVRALEIYDIDYWCNVSFEGLVHLLTNVTLLRIGNSRNANQTSFACLKRIAVCCKNLKCLHIACPVNIDTDFLELDALLLPSVKCIRFSCPTPHCSNVNAYVLQHILSLCINIEIVSIGWDVCSDKIMFVIFLRHFKALSKLKELYWLRDNDICYNMDFLINRMVSLCPSLKIIGGIEGQPRKKNFHGRRIRILPPIVVMETRET